MSRKFLILFISIFFTTVLVGSIYMYYNSFKSEPEIVTMTAKVSPPVTIEGIVRPDVQYTVRYHTKNGIPKNLQVHESDRVKTTTPLFTYYNPQIANKVKTLRHLQKIKPSHTKYFQDQLTELEDQIETTLYSPIDGIVHLHKIFPSTNQAKILEINSIEQHIAFEIPEHLYHYFKVKQTVDIKRLSDFKTYKGTIISIAQAPTPTKEKRHHSVYQLTLKTSNPFPLGQHFNFEIEPSHIILPADTLLDQHSIIIYKNGKYIKRIINYDRINEQLLINKGVFIGEKVVRNPNANLSKPS